MWNKELSPAKLYVYRLSNTLTNILYLREDDTDFDELADRREKSLLKETGFEEPEEGQETGQIHNYFLTNDRLTRHHRFRSVLRKPAQKRIHTAATSGFNFGSSFKMSNTVIADFFWWVFLGGAVSFFIQAW